MKELQQLCLTISTFSNINHKGVYMILKSIGGLQTLKILSLNFSDINLPQKYLSYLKLPLSLKSLSLDLSCNPNLSDIDILSLTSKLSPSSESWPKIYSLKLNFDFCKKISEQALEQLVQNLSKSKFLLKLMLVDRNYSKQFIRRCVKILESGICSKSIILFGTNSLKDMLAQDKSPRKEGIKKRRLTQEADQKQKNALIQKQGDSKHKNQEKYYDYENYKIREKYIRNVLFSSYLIRKNGFLKSFQRDLIRLFLP